MYIEGLTWFIGNLEGTGVPLLVGVGRWFEAFNMAVFAQSPTPMSHETPPG